MTSIVEYFAQDPLRILYVVGGSGGIWFWVSQWRGRVRLAVRSLQHQIHDSTQSDIKLELRFEVENLGDSPTSIEQFVWVSGFDKDGVKETAKLSVGSPERRLDPHSPKGLLAVANVEATYVFWVFRTYDFRITKGSGRKLRFRSQLGVDPMSLWRYAFELAIFRASGKLPFLRDAA